MSSQPQVPQGYANLVVNVARKSPFDIYIGRSLRGFTSTGWDNQHKILGTSLRSRLGAIIAFGEDLLNDEGRLEQLGELHGKVLGCWCSPKLCHGHLLSMWASEGTQAALAWIDELRLAQQGCSYRLLVTGSRGWEDEEVMRGAFLTIWQKWGKPNPITLVVGDAKGADEMAVRLWAKSGWPVEVHVPDWEGKGRAAGMARNVEMINSGVDFLLAFAKGDTAGTQGCLAAARKAYVPCLEYRT